MSFSVQHLPTGLEFCGTSLNHIFGQRKNIFRPRFWKMILHINRFNMEAIEALSSANFQHYTLGEYVRERKYGDDFLNFYLVPMSSAVWSKKPSTNGSRNAAPGFPTQPGISKICGAIPERSISTAWAFRAKARDGR